MRVHLWGTESLAPLFRERGDRVSFGEPLPLDADLYLLSRDSENLRRLEQGLVILDLRADADPALADRLPYADLGLVDDRAARAALAETVGCEPDRLFIVDDDRDLLALIDRALADDLPPAVVVTEEPPQEAAPDEAALAVRLAVLARQADVMLRGYRVRSKLPLIGPLIAWFRRNLTSHLREPYLDPILERQVALNRELVAILQEMLQRQTALETRLKRLEERQNDGNEGPSCH